MKQWLAETHGVKFELFRHFLTRMFESDLAASRGRWQTIAISLFAAILPGGILFGDYAAKYRHLARLSSPVPFQSAAVADELSILTLLMALSGLVALLQWQSLFPGRRDYFAFAALPIRSRQIFFSRFAAVFCFLSGVVFTTLFASMVIPAQMTGRWQKNPSAVMNMSAHTVAVCLACYFMFLAVMALQGVLLQVVPRKWFLRVSVYMQGVGMAICFLAALLSLTISDWTPITVARLPSFGSWLPPVWFVSLHETLLGDRSPFFVAMRTRGLLAFAIAASLTILTYLAAYGRYRRLMVEAPSEAGASRQTRLSLLRLVSPEPESQAVMEFMTTVLARSRTHRVVLMAYVGAGVGLVFNAVLLSRLVTHLREHWLAALQFLVLFVPIAFSVIVLAGFRHAAALPAELRANWIFRSTEAIGRSRWMLAVERFAMICILGPIYLLMTPIAFAVLGWQLALRMSVLQIFVSATIFEVLFANWQQLPFTCSYLPGKRPVMATVARILGALGVFVPLVCFAIGFASREWITFAPGAVVFAAIWWWTRARRLDGWGQLGLVYEDADPVVLELGISGAAYRPPTSEDPNEERRESEQNLERVEIRRSPAPADRPVEIGIGLFRVMAKAFPREFRNGYGDEMLRVAEDTIQPVWRREGVLGLLRLLANTGVRAVVEHLTLLWEDTRYGLRVLTRSPGFTAVALISLSLGICVATCADSEMNGIVLRNIPAVTSADELVGTQAPISYPYYKRYRELGDLFSSTLAYAAPVPLGVSLDGRTERIWGHLVTSSYFSTLGVRPMMGRTFDQQEEQPTQQATLVISYRFWQSVLGGDPDVIGRTLHINGQPATIIGVGPKDFLGASPAFYVADLWMPLSAAERIAPELAGNALERRDLKMLQFVGRLKPGVTVAQAESELDAVTRQLEKEFGDEVPSDNSPRVLLVTGGKILPLRKQDIPLFTEFFMVLAGLVLLIACANVANMMLARAADRHKEVAIRMSLGASRLRIIRQLLTESILLALAAGSLGFAVSVYVMHLASQLRMPFPIPIRYDLSVDWHALVFTLVVTVFTGLLFGLAPALQATRVVLTPALKEGGNVPLRRHRRLSLRNALLVAQLAGSLMLLLILGLLSLGIQTTMGIAEGFDPKNLYLISIDPVRDGYSSERAADFLHKLLEDVQKMPSVSSASLTESVPVLLDGNPGVAFSIPDADPKQAHSIHWSRKSVVGKDYFDTTGIPILMGRGFRKEDEADDSRVVIVSQKFVQDVWKGQDPLGRRIEITNDNVSGTRVTMPGSFDIRPSALEKHRQVFQVVGVAGDVANDLIVSKKHPAIYFPLRPADYAQPSLLGVTLMVRSTSAANTLDLLRREIAEVDANITPFNARSMEGQIREFMSPLRAAAWTYGLIGIFGLVLAAVGLAGVTAYSVAQRAHEIGIRMALGARQADVLGLVMKEGVLMVMIGTLLGLGAAWAGMRMLAGLFSSVASTSASNPTLILGAPLLLGGLALVSCYLPARRSTQIEPAVALRQE
jgi:predicted permease